MLKSVGKVFTTKALQRIKSFRCFSSHLVYYQQSSSAPSTEDKLILTADDNGVRRITLNSVKKRNALSLVMLTELKEHLLNADKEKTVRVVIIDHNGPVFSSGHDLKELRTETGSSYHAQVFERCTEVMNLLQDISLPVIAEVNGVATAAGCQMVATCDLAVATTKSTFAVPGVHIGLFCTTPGVALSRAIDRKQAMKMLLTGDPITAQEALTSGLLNDVVEETQLKETTNHLARKILRHSRPVIKLGKEAFYKQINEQREAAYCYAENIMVQNLQHEDSQEGIGAFFQKRKPIWTNDRS